MKEAMTEIMHLANEGLLADQDSGTMIEKLFNIAELAGKTLLRGETAADKGRFFTPKGIVDELLPKYDQATDTGRLLMDIPSTLGMIDADGEKKHNSFYRIAPNVKLVRFRGNDETKLVGRNKPEDKNTQHIYEICVSRLDSLSPWTATATIDGRFAFNVSAKTRSRAEKLAIAAYHRYLKETHRSNKRRGKTAAEVAK